MLIASFGLTEICLVEGFMKRWFIARTTAAALLLFAAMAKGYQVLWLPPTLTVLNALWLVVAQVELVLGLALLMNISAPVTRKISLCVFGAFFCTNVYGIANGFSSCSCLGAIKLSPWAMAFVDGVLLTLLGWSRASEPVAVELELKESPWKFWSCAGGAFVAAALALAVVRQFNTTKITYDTVLNFGPVAQRGSFLKHTVVRNSSPFPMRIVGISSYCGVSLEKSVGQTIEPYSSKTLEFEIFTQEKSGLFETPIRVFVDHPSMTSIPFVIRGEVR